MTISATFLCFFKWKFSIIIFFWWIVNDSENSIKTSSIKIPRNLKQMNSKCFCCNFYALFCHFLAINCFHSLKNTTYKKRTFLLLYSFFFIFKLLLMLIYFYFFLFFAFFFLINNVLLIRRRSSIEGIYEDNAEEIFRFFSFYD